MKLGVIGGSGVLGSSAAFYVALNNYVDEIILYDVRENYAMSHAIDIDQGVSGMSTTTVTAGSLSSLKECGIIINTVGAPDSSSLSRDGQLSCNLPICMSFAEEIKSWGSCPVIITATNPVDVLNYKLYEYIGGPRNRYLAFSLNDTLRLGWSIAKELGLPTTMVDAIVLGEHGDSQVPVFTSAKRKDTGEAIVLTEEQKQSVKKRNSDWFKGMLALGATRTMGWSTCVGLGRMVEAIATESDTVLPCSCIPNGEYGLSDVSLALPLKLGKEGWREIVTIPLNDEETDGLKASADKIKSVICSAK